MPIFQITFFGITFGPTWYGLMYVLAFMGAWGLLTWRGPFSRKQLDDLIFWGLIGVVLGGRLGYVVLYNLSYFLAHPLEILQPWKGGMSFHGGLMGVIVVMLVMARRWRVSFWRVADAAAWVAPLGLMLGRIGNYINGELLGWKGYTGPLAVVRDGVSYFPTPLLEAGLEGLLLFIVTSWAYFRWAYVRTPAVDLGHPERADSRGLQEGEAILCDKPGSLPGRSAFSAVRKKDDLPDALADDVSSSRAIGGNAGVIVPGRTALLFMAGYAVARFIAEFFRDPDPQVGYLLWGWVTAGMGLSVLMVVASLYLLHRK